MDEDGNILNGNIFLIENRGPKISSLIYNSFTENKYNGKYISNHDPKKLSTEYNIPTDNITWLTTIAGENNIGPSQITKLENMCINFAKKNKDKGILSINNLGYLCLSSETDSVLKSVYNISDHIIYYNSVLLLQVAPGILPDYAMIHLRQKADKTIGPEFVK